MNNVLGKRVAAAPTPERNLSERKQGERSSEAFGRPTLQIAFWVSELRPSERRTVGTDE